MSRELKDCVCGRPAKEHRFDWNLKAFMESKDRVCEGYEPSDGVIRELNFDKPMEEDTDEEIDEEVTQ